MLTSLVPISFPFHNKQEEIISACGASFSLKKKRWQCNSFIKALFFLSLAAQNICLAVPPEELGLFSKAAKTIHLIWFDYKNIWHNDHISLDESCWKNALLFAWGSYFELFSKLLGSGRLDTWQILGRVGEMCHMTLLDSQHNFSHFYYAIAAIDQKSYHKETKKMLHFNLQLRIVWTNYAECIGEPWNHQDDILDNWLHRWQISE